MMRTKLVLLMAMLLLGSITFAQNIRVTGKITEGSTGEPLPGVSVQIKGTTTGTVTDFDGNYSISAPSDGALISSFIGYKPQEVAINGRSTIDIKLEEDNVALDEVVAVGYGVVKKRDITGSVGSVSSEKLLATPITSLDAGLQGKIAGVQIQQTTGAPGQKMKIRVRGGSSINFGNEPLYVIDGFIGADITTINPNDIATIDILKDASATAIYGSRGANGVVLITTNSPKAGEPTITFDANVGVSNMVNEYELLSAGDMAELMNLRTTQKNAADGTSASLPFTQDELAYFKKNGGTNWADEVTRQGIKQNYTLNYTGGTEKLKYYFSANYVDDKGVIDESFYKRASVRSNISGMVTKNIDFKFNTYATSTSSQNNGRQNNGTANTLGSAVTYPQVWAPYDENGEFIDPTTYNDHNGAFRPGADANPIVRNMQNQETWNRKIISNFDLNFKLAEGLTFTVSNAGSFNFGFNGSRDLVDGVTYDRNTVGAQQKYSTGSTYLNTENLTYKKRFGKHDLTLSAIYEFSKSQWQNNSVKTSGLSTLANEWYILQNGSNVSTPTSAYNEEKMRSWMGRFNYSYNDKYLLTASVRADGVSVFQKDQQWGYFPSAAFAWRLSEEGFIQDLGWIHNLKLRAGAGVTGNKAIGAYFTQTQMNNKDYSTIYWTKDGTTPSIGVVPDRVVDPLMQWEKNAQYNAGVDIAVMNGRLSATLDVYQKRSTDVILEVTTPSYLGYYNNATMANYGEVDNKGFELGINWQILDNSDLQWDMNFNLAKNKNTVKSLSGTQDFVFLGDEEALGIWMGGTNNKFIVKEGESMGTLFGLRSLGLWQEGEEAEAEKYGSYVGEPKYEDVKTVDTDGDGIPDEGDGQINDSDRQIIGNATPEFTYGFGTSVAYKGFDLAIQCVGSVGNDIYNYSRVLMDQELLNPEYLNRWTPSSQGSSQQALPIGKEYARSYVTSQYVEDGSFFKISNLSLGYTVPKNVAERLKLQSLRFYVSGTNLLTITDYSGLDPEGSSSNLSSDSQSGVDAFSYPLTRTFTGGVKVVF